MCSSQLGTVLTCDGQGVLDGVLERNAVRLNIELYALFTTPVEKTLGEWPEVLPWKWRCDVFPNELVGSYPADCLSLLARLPMGLLATPRERKRKLPTGHSCHPPADYRRFILRTRKLVRIICILSSHIAKKAAFVSSNFLLPSAYE